MVPMRGMKFKFAEGEKVLCYEPDPTKARVLYDSKVLEVNVNRDKKGRKAVEYLIHFQGWNSSWDRYVSEDHILKHTEENWKLQRELAEKAQLRPTAYLYRRDHKGHKGNELPYRASNRSEHSVSSRTASATTSREGSPSTHSNYSTVSDKDESNRRKDTSDHRKRREKCVMEDEHLPSAYEEIDDSDGECGIKHEIDSGDSREAHSDEEEEEDDDDDGNTRVEGAGDNYSEDFGDHNNTDNSDSSSEAEVSGEDADDVSQSEGGAHDHAEEENFPLEFTSIMKDILELDNELIKNTNKLVILPATPNVVTILESYVREYAINQICGAPENSRRKYRQRHNHQTGPPDMERINRSINICKEVADGVRIYFDFTLSGLLLYNEEKEQYELSRRINFKQEPDPSTTSNSLSYQTPGALSDISSVEDMLRSRGCPPTLLKFLLSQVVEWRLVPESSYTEIPLPPSLVYGAVHLARLFVKLPGLLRNTDMQTRKLKLVFRHLQMILRYLEQNRSWFGEEFYYSNLEQKMERL